MVDIYDRALIENKVYCDNSIHDFLYESDLMLMDYNNKSSKDKETINERMQYRFAKLMVECARNDLELCKIFIESEDKDKEENKDSPKKENLTPTEIAHILVNIDMKKIEEETEIQCKVGRMLIEKIAKTGIANEKEVSDFLNKGARFINQNLNKQGLHKLTAYSYVQAYNVGYKIENDVAKDIEYFKTLKNKSLPKAAMGSIIKVFNMMRKYRNFAQKSAKMYMNRYNELEKKDK